MKFLHIIPTPDPFAFDKHVARLVNITKLYLHDNGHETDALFLDTSYDDYGWCEELIYHLNNTGQLKGYDFIIFSHTDVVINKFTFLDHIDTDHAFGRPYYFVCSVPLIEILCKIKVRYCHDEGVFHMKSIFHGDSIRRIIYNRGFGRDTAIEKGKITHITPVTPETNEASLNYTPPGNNHIPVQIYFDDRKLLRKIDTDHADHILYLNMLGKLYPALLYREAYRPAVELNRVMTPIGIAHMVGVGCGAKLFYGAKCGRGSREWWGRRKAEPSANGFTEFKRFKNFNYKYRVKGIIKYMMFNFRHAPFTDEEIDYATGLINYAIVHNVFTAEQINKHIDECIEYHEQHVSNGISLNSYMADKLYVKS